MKCNLNLAGGVMYIITTQMYIDFNNNFNGNVANSN